MWLRSFGTNGNNQTRIAAQLGLSLCTVTNAHHRFELFCLMRNNLFFSVVFIFLSKPNMLLISCMLYVCDSWGRGNWQTKDASSANRLRPGGHDWKCIHMTSSTSLFPLSSSFPASSIIILWDTSEWQRPVAVTELYIQVVENLAFSSTVCVWYPMEKQSSCFVFLSFVSVGATAGPGSRVGSRCHDAMMKFLFTCTSLRSKETWRKKLQNIWIWGTDEHVSDKWNQAFETTRCSLWDQRCGRDRCADSAKVSDGRAQKNKSDGQNCVLSLFPKKPYCYCNIMKTLMLYYDDLFYMT